MLKFGTELGIIEIHQRIANNHSQLITTINVKIFLFEYCNVLISYIKSFENVDKASLDIQANLKIFVPLIQFAIDISNNHIISESKLRKRFKQFSKICYHFEYLTKLDDLKLKKSPMWVYCTQSTYLDCIACFYV